LLSFLGSPRSSRGRQSRAAGAVGFVGNSLISMGEARGMDYLKALSKQQIYDRIPAWTKLVGELFR